MPIQANSVASSLERAEQLFLAGLKHEDRLGAKKYSIAKGKDDRTIALAIYLYNKDRPGSGVYRDYSDYVKSKKVNAAVNALDYWMIETRANYQSVKLYTGGEVVLPPVSYINEMRRRGELEKRPDFVNTLVDTGQVIRGLYDGVNEGFFEAFVSTGEDLYNMIVDIFTGEIFNQITDLFSMFMEKGLEGVWEMIKDFGMATWAEVQAAWNNPNAYERGKYFGEIIGAVAFEVVLALLTMGIGTAVKMSTKTAKILKWLPNLNKVKQIIPSTQNRYAIDLKKMNLDIEKKKLDVETKKVPEATQTPVVEKKIPTTKPVETEKPDLVEEKIASEKLPETEISEGEVMGAQQRSGVDGVSKIIPKTIDEIKHLLKTDENKSFFWSGKTNGFGGEARALEIAKSKGGITLEGLLNENNIELPAWNPSDPNVMKLWEDVSAEYAKQVSGEVRAVVGQQLRQGNIWQTKELPALMENTSVTKITIIDAETLIETIIFTR